MSDLLDGLGLKPESTEPAPAEPEEVTPLDPEDDVIVVPEGAEKPDAVKAAIAAERKRAREAYAQARELEARLKKIEEENKPLPDRLNAAEKRATDAELKALRLEVGLDQGLSRNLALRLAGSDRESLEQDAKSLLEEMGSKPTPRLPGLDGGVRPAPPAPANPAQAHNNFLAQILSGRQPGA